MAVFEIAVVLVLIALNGLFALSELAVVFARRSRLRTLAQEGRKGANRALALASDPSRFLSTAQIGITAVGLAASAYSGATLSADLWPASYRATPERPHRVRRRGQAEEHGRQGSKLDRSNSNVHSGYLGMAGNFESVRASLRPGALPPKVQFSAHWPSAMLQIASPQLSHRAVVRRSGRLRWQAGLRSPGAQDAFA